MVVSNIPAPTTKKSLEERFDTDWMTTRSATKDALVFLAEDTTSGRVRAETDVEVIGPNGLTLAVLEVKRAMPTSGKVSWCARLLTDGRPPVIVPLADKDASARIRGLLFVLALPPASASVLPGFALLLAGYLGVRLAPHVDKLANHTPMRALALIILSGVTLGVGAWLHLTIVWSAGVTGLMCLPLARLAQDCQAEDRLLASIGN